MAVVINMSKPVAQGRGSQSVKADTNGPQKWVISSVIPCSDRCFCRDVFSVSDITMLFVSKGHMRTWSEFWGQMVLMNTECQSHFGPVALLWLTFFYYKILWVESLWKKMFEEFDSNMSSPSAQELIQSVGKCLHLSCMLLSCPLRNKSLKSRKKLDEHAEHQHFNTTTNIVKIRFYGMVHQNV